MSTSTEIDRVIKGFYCTSIGLDNDLVPGRWQLIISTSDSLVYWRIYASLDDLGRVGRVKFLIELYLYIRDLPEPFVISNSPICTSA